MAEPSQSQSSFRRSFAVSLSFLFAAGHFLFFLYIALLLGKRIDYYSTILNPAAPSLLMFGSLFIAIAAIVIFVVFLRKPEAGAWYGKMVDETVQALDKALTRRMSLWIAVSSAIVLFLELCLIRWMAALVPHLSLFRNFGLLACFLGIGLGYLTGRSRPFLLPLLLPLIGLQFLHLSFVAQFYD